MLLYLEFLAQKTQTTNAEDHMVMTAVCKEDTQAHSTESLYHPDFTFPSLGLDIC